jgi:hypothetical protein
MFPSSGDPRLPKPIELPPEKLKKREKAVEAWRMEMERRESEWAERRTLALGLGRHIGANQQKVTAKTIERCSVGRSIVAWCYLFTTMHANSRESEIVQVIAAELKDAIDQVILMARSEGTVREFEECDRTIQRDIEIMMRRDFLRAPMEPEKT